MKAYMDFDTGEAYTLDELQRLFEQYKWEMYPDNYMPTFEEWFEEQLIFGRQGIGGLEEVEE